MWINVLTDFCNPSLVIFGYTIRLRDLATLQLSEFSCNPGSNGYFLHNSTTYPEMRTGKVISGMALSFFLWANAIYGRSSRIQYNSLCATLNRDDNSKYCIWDFVFVYGRFLLLRKVFSVICKYIRGIIKVRKMQGKHVE